MTPIRLLIVDDHPIVREGLRLILETVEDMTVIGEAADGAEAIALTDTLKPDVVLMDMQMPVMDGLTAIRRILAVHPDQVIVILTTYNEDQLMVEGLRAGARGFLLKDSRRETLIAALRAGARGETLLTADVTARLLKLTQPSAAPTLPASLDNGLTPRELEVLRGAAAGLTNKGIARALAISERTVKAHLSSIFEKFGVGTRAEALLTAARRGIALPD